MFFLATSLGDVGSGVLTQVLRSRRKAMFYTLLFGMLATTFLLGGSQFVRFNQYLLYTVYFALGLASGCWALATMITAENFGTNIRATSSLAMLNLLRGFTIPMVIVFNQLQPSMGLTGAAAAIGVVLYGASFFAIKQLSETFSRDLDFVED